MDEQPAPNAIGDEAWCEQEAAAVGKEDGPSRRRSEMCQAISEANRFSVSVRLSPMIPMMESISSLVMTSGGPR